MVGKGSRLELLAGLDCPSCIPSVHVSLLLWMHSSVMQQVVWVNLAVGSCGFRCTVRSDVEAV
jgi:hypothetical protein